MYTLLVTVTALIVGLGVCLLFNACMLWVLVWALHGLGFYTIGSFAIAFSWKLAIAITAVLAIIKGTGISINSKK